MTIVRYKNSTQTFNFTGNIHRKRSPTFLQFDRKRRIFSMFKYFYARGSSFEQYRELLFGLKHRQLIEEEKNVQLYCARLTTSFVPLNATTRTQKITTVLSNWGNTSRFGELFCGKSIMHLLRTLYGDDIQFTETELHFR